MTLTRGRARCWPACSSCALVVALWGLAGCNLVWPYDSQERDAPGGPDLPRPWDLGEAGSLDAALRDALPDGPGLDGLRPDVTAQPDGAPDSKAKPDGKLPPDAAGPPDSKPVLDSKPVPDSAGPPDSKPVPDSKAVPDGPTPLPDGPLAPCAANASVVGNVIFKGNTAYAFCQTGSGVTQCGAGLLCNGNQGWNLCPASSYRGAFGNTPTALKNNQVAWISGCVRNTGLPFGPLDNVCLCDAGTSPSAVDVAWSCTDGLPSLTTGQLNLGLTTSSTCNRVGENLATTAAYWYPRPAADGMTAKLAVCCK